MSTLPYLKRDRQIPFFIHALMENVIALAAIMRC